MRRRPTAPRLQPAHPPSHRLAWWAAFLTTIALILLLNAARADAAALPGGLPSLPVLAGLEPEEEGEEEAGFGEEAEELEDAPGEAECVEDEEEGECVEGAEAARPPRECLLAAASATVSVYPHSRRVVLVLHYTAPVPTRAQISYRLRGARGGLAMGTERRRLAGNGALRDVKTLSAAKMARVLAARSFEVEVRPLEAPAYCGGYFSQRLTVRRATAHGPVWTGQAT